MANLLTKQQIHSIKTEYWIRLASFSLLMAAVLGAFVLAYVIPYNVIISDYEKTISDQVAAAVELENKENAGESVSKIVSRTSDQLKLAEIYRHSTWPSDSIREIISQKNKSIHITKLSATIADISKGHFLISGIADNRDNLVNFIEQLRSDRAFTNVESPISDFAKSSNIPFTISLKINL